MSDGPMSEEQLRTVTIGEPSVLGGPIELADYDPAWAVAFDKQSEKIVAALGTRALAVDHVGSTSVPGLAAKPILDILLVVADSADEASYVFSLEQVGFVLRAREPDWYEHRMFKSGTEPKVNLHVFSQGCTEIDRMLSFRDRLRAHADDRARYEQAKRELAAREWKYVQNYADAKSAVIEEILGRAGDDLL